MNGYNSFGCVLYLTFLKCTSFLVIWCSEFSFDIHMLGASRLLTQEVSCSLHEASHLLVFDMWSINGIPVIRLQGSLTFDVCQMKQPMIDQQRLIMVQRIDIWHRWRMTTNRPTLPQIQHVVHKHKLAEQRIQYKLLHRVWRWRRGKTTACGDKHQGRAFHRSYLPLMYCSSGFAILHTS